MQGFAISDLFAVRNEEFTVDIEGQRLWAETDNLVFGFEHSGKSSLNILCCGCVFILFNVKISWLQNQHMFKRIITFRI